MKGNMEERAGLLARYMVENEATVRAAAGQFGVSKSTVHKDVSQRLRRQNPGLYREVRKVLARNKAERHLRGGQATREKYARARAAWDKRRKNGELGVFYEKNGFALLKFNRVTDFPCAIRRDAVQ